MKILKNEIKNLVSVDGNPSLLRIKMLKNLILTFDSANLF